MQVFLNSGKVQTVHSFKLLTVRHRLHKDISQIILTNKSSTAHLKRIHRQPFDWIRTGNQ